MTWQRLEERLRERIGLDPDVGGREYLERAVNRRLKALGFRSDEVDRYESRLNGDEVELLALIEEVVVSESWFFRDEIPFEYLGRVVESARLAQSDSRRIRILSCPCSRGEEPYTIAMALIKLGLSPESFRIDAIDLSPEAIADAKAAVYSHNAFRTKNLDFRDAYFLRAGSNFQLCDEIRRLVHFQVGNLLDTTFSFSQTQYEIIFCRNLLIYFDRDARSRVVSRLAGLLVENGVLFVGHAEGNGFLGSKFHRAGDRGAFAFRKVGSLDAKHGTDKPPVVPPKVSITAPKPVTGNHPLEPAKPPNSIAPAPTRPVTLEDAQALADKGKHAEAAEVCSKLLVSRGARPEVWFLLGLVRRATGDRDEADRCFEKTVYLDAKHEEALLALATSAQRRGDVKSSDNFKRRAANAAKERTS